MITFMVYHQVENRIRVRKFNRLSTPISVNVKLISFRHGSCLYFPLWLAKWLSGSGKFSVQQSALWRRSQLLTSNSTKLGRVFANFTDLGQIIWSPVLRFLDKQWLDLHCIQNFNFWSYQNNFCQIIQLQSAHGWKFIFQISLALSKYDSFVRLCYVQIPNILQLSHNLRRRDCNSKPSVKRNCNIHYWKGHHHLVARQWLMHKWVHQYVCL